MEHKKIIINIGRQYGDGGRYIAKKLAERFNARYFDREILDLAAQESGFSPDYFQENDERKSFFRSLFHLHAPMVSDSNFYGNKFSDESLFQFQCDAIRKAAAQDNCIFIGRCADYVLRDEPDAVSVFITANIDDRIKNVSLREQVDADTARKIIQKKENARASFYNYYTGKKWGAAESYDLIVNVSVLGIDPTTDFIADFIQRKHLG